MSNLLKSTEDKECLICADKMRGEVILECGHGCCATCFAKHSRLDNKCPFCRMEFAPPIKKNEEMSIYTAEEIASLTLRQSRDLNLTLMHPDSPIISSRNLSARQLSEISEIINDVIMNSALRAIINTLRWYDGNIPTESYRELTSELERYTRVRQQDALQSLSADTLIDLTGDTRLREMWDAATPVNEAAVNFEEILELMESNINRIPLMEDTPPATLDIVQELPPLEIMQRQTQLRRSRRIAERNNINNI